MKKQLRRIKNVWRRFRESRRVRRVANAPEKPILIYQMGKVASTSVQSSLDAVNVDAFQIHRLNPESLRAAVNKYQTRRRQFPRHLHRSLLVDRHIMQRGIPVRIISLVREPIGRNISAYFENLDDVLDVENAHEKLTVGQLIEGFFNRFPHRGTLEWFDQEFQPAVGIDVYAHPFSPNDGWIQFSEKGHDVLILRADLDDGKKADAVRRFVNLQTLPWVQRNFADDAAYGSVYREFKKTIQLPPEYVREMLESRFTRHFFSETEIEQIARRWQRTGA